MSTCTLHDTMVCVRDFVLPECLHLYTSNLREKRVFQMKSMARAELSILYVYRIIITCMYVFRAFELAVQEFDDYVYTPTRHAIQCKLMVHV